MATITRYVNTASTAGGDGTTNDTAGATRAYASLSEWESAMGAGNSADDYIVYCSGTAADTTAVTLNFPYLTCQIVGHPSSGTGRYTGNAVISTSHYRLRTTTSTPLILSPSTVGTNGTMTVDGIQIITASGGAYGGIDTAGCFYNTIVKNCRIQAEGAASVPGLGMGGSAAGSVTNNWTYENNLIVGYQVGIRHAAPAGWLSSVTIRNNTIYGQASSHSGIVGADDSTAQCTYSVFANAVGNSSSTASIVITKGTSAPAITYADNACSVASSTTDEIVLGTASDAWTSPGTSASSDFTVKNTSSSLYNAVNPTRASTDITGFTRDGTNHDVGAFEYQAAASGVGGLTGGKLSGGGLLLNGLVR